LPNILFVTVGSNIGSGVLGGILLDCGHFPLPIFKVFAFNLTNIVVQIGFRANSTAKIAFFRITQSHVEINFSGHF
jgi:hypothetical protein